MAADENTTTPDERPEEQETTAAATGVQPGEAAQDVAETTAMPEDVLEAEDAAAETAAAVPEETEVDPAEVGASAAEPSEEALASPDDAAETAGEPGAEEAAAPSPAFDPMNPFAVPADVLNLLRTPQRPARTHDEDADLDDEDLDEEHEDGEEAPAVARRRRRRRRGAEDMELEGGEDGDPENTVTRVRAPRSSSTASDTVQGVKGSTRLEAKRQRRRDSRTGGRRRTVITEAEFLARRESVDRKMLVRQRDQRIQIAVLEDGVLAEHFVSHTTQDSMIGSVYLGKVQNVLPSMEAAFVDIGRGRNAVLYAGEVNWDAAQLDGKPKKIENALKSGDTVLVQVTKDPVGHKGARLTSQVSLPGRYLVYVPGGSMTGISRKLPDVERARLKKILKDHLPQDAGVIVRTAAEGTSEQELQNDINRLRAQWEGIQGKAASGKVLAPELLYAEPDLTIKTVRDVFNEDFSAMLVQGEGTWDNIEAYVTYVAPHLLDRLHHWVPEDHDGEDLYATHRVDEQLHKALERKVYLPSGGSLVIDRTEAMTVVDVNTGKFTGSGGNLEETVTKNNLEAAEEIVRQLRLRDIGGIIVIDFIDMVLESNRDLVLRRLVECLGRDRTKHQVAEVTSLGLVQMTRKRMGTGLVEVFSENCEHCAGRGILIHDTPVERSKWQGEQRPDTDGRRRGGKRRKGGQGDDAGTPVAEPTAEEATEEERQRRERAAAARAALQSIAKASGKADEHVHDAPSEGVTGPADEQEPEEGLDAGAPGDSEDEAGGRRRKRRGRRRGCGRAQDSGPEASADEAGQGAEHADTVADADGEPTSAEAADEAPTEAQAGAAVEESEPALETAADTEDVAAETTGGDARGTRRGRSRGRSRGGRDRSGAVRAPDVSEEPVEPTAAVQAEEVVSAPEAPAPADQSLTTEQAGVITFDGEPVAVPRRRGPRRASSDGVTAPAGGMRRLEEALERKVEPAAEASVAPAEEPVAAPSSMPDAPAVEEEAPAEAPVAAPAEPARPTRRRSRRAVSSDGVQVQVQEAAAPAAEGSRFTASAAPVAARPAETAAPVMLGVGVKAEDIVRG